MQEQAVQLAQAVSVLKLEGDGQGAAAGLAATAATVGRSPAPAARRVTGAKEIPRQKMLLTTEGENADGYEF